MLLRLLLALGAALALLFLIGCQPKQGGGDVMASVDGRKILRSDVEKYYLNQTSSSDQPQLPSANRLPAYGSAFCASSSTTRS